MVAMTTPTPWWLEGLPGEALTPPTGPSFGGEGGGGWKIPPHLWIKGFYSPPDPMLLDQTNLGRLCKKPPTLPRWMDTKFKSMPPPF